jgi:hypothetical protein
LDGTVVHQADLNALAQNLTNLYGYNQGGFATQRPAALAQQTSAQTIPTSTDTLLTFNAATINTDNMWVASQPAQLTIQVAGIYILFAQTFWPGNRAVSGATPWVTMDILVNGTSGTAVSHAGCGVISSATTATPGAGLFSMIPANLASGGTVFLSCNQNYGASVPLPVSRGGAYLGAIYMTNAT